MASAPTLPRPMVYPSGAERAIASVPTLPPEPVRFSTANCWPVISLILEHHRREMMSVPPPGGNSPMKRAGAAGHGCLWARAALAAARQAAVNPSAAVRRGIGAADRCCAMTLLPREDAGKVDGT